MKNGQFRHGHWAYCIYLHILARSRFVRSKNRSLAVDRLRKKNGNNLCANGLNGLNSFARNSDDCGKIWREIQLGCLWK
jgi:hypothetical protein